VTPIPGFAYSVLDRSGRCVGVLRCLSYRIDWEGESPVSVYLLRWAGQSTTWEARDRDLERLGSLAPARYVC